MRQSVPTTETAVVMQDTIVQWFAGFSDQIPLIGTLFALSVIDVITGLMAAGKKGNISSKVSWNGTAKKVGLFLAVAVGNILEPFSGIPLGRMTAMFYVVTEAISITENLDRSGVPVPKFLKEMLLKLKSDSADKVPGSITADTNTTTDTKTPTVHSEKPPPEAK